MHKIEDGKSAFKRWYDRHKDEYNAMRKDRYHADRTYRETRIREARQYRDALKITGESLEVEDNGRKITVYPIKTVAEWLGKSVPTIYSWIAKEWIPKSDFDPASYTQQQCLLIRRVSQARDMNFSAKVFDEVVSNVKDAWHDR
jgi:hypothetical protein